MHGSEGSRAGTLLGLAGAGAVGAFWTGQDAAHGEDQDMAVGEFLLELAGQALLDLVEAGEDRDGDEDNNGALAVADFKLWKAIVLVSISCAMYDLLRLHLIVPHEQRRIAGVSKGPSGRGCWSRVRKGRLRCWFPARRGFASKDCCERSC